MTPWNKGKPHSDDVKAKMRANHADVKGENNPMFGIRRFGKDNPNFGNKFSLDVRNKFASYGALGKKHTKEQIDKMRIAQRLRVAEGKHHFWKGGITELRQLIKSSSEYKEWRNSIYNRDNWTCQICNKHSKGDIEAHHKFSFSLIVEKYGIKTLDDARNCPPLWDTNNGLTVCVSCHRHTANYSNGFRNCQELIS